MNSIILHIDSIIFTPQIYRRLALHPDRDHFASSSGDKSVKIWCASSLQNNTQPAALSKDTLRYGPCIFLRNINKISAINNVECLQRIQLLHAGFWAVREGSLGKYFRNVYNYLNSASQYNLIEGC